MNIKKTQNCILILIVCITIISLITLMYLGFFTHPLGDDFHYGQYAKEALRKKGFLSALLVAIDGVKEQYNIWQGTYAAMFIMYLPPHIFGEFVYKLYPCFVLLSLAFSTFYLFKPIIISFFSSTKKDWIILSSITLLMFIEYVPVLGEAFYWYNGSAYYNGFFSLSLIYLGIQFRYLHKRKPSYSIWLSVLGIIIAGGNYASLLPCVIISTLLLLYLIIKKKPIKTLIGFLVPYMFTLIGFFISITAPGNTLRAATTYGATPIKAILKSLLQGFSYIRGWSNVWFALTIALFTPLFFKISKNTNFSFRFPLLYVAISFGIFSSASCPSFYGQNNGGPARLFDICWYMMVLFILSCYFYFIGWINHHNYSKLYWLPVALLIALCFISSFFRTKDETFPIPNSIKALSIIVNGDAKYYEQQYQDRMNTIASNHGDITFAPYDVPESLNNVLHLGDLSNDTNNQNNLAFARFYELDSVKISNQD